MLSAHSITHKYNDFIALDSVSIDIKPGEIVGLLGKNGAGKSSLMRVLTGFMQPTEGIVHFDGLELQDKAKIIQSQIGYLPENNILYDEMSVFDYLAFVSEIRGVPKSKRMRLLSKAIFKTPHLSGSVSIHIYLLLLKKPFGFPILNGEFANKAVIIG